MSSLHDVKLSVLRKIMPPKEEEKRVNDFVREAVRIVKTVSGIDCAVCGSTGKFTWLKGDHDIDVFMLFSRTVSREELEKKGLEFGRQIAKELKGKAMIKYAEHPYTRVYANGFEIDIVPCYRIKNGEPIISAVDRSPLHLQYILENLDPSMRDEVRLLKQFCKGIDVYGSDTKTLGFSGYICELLAIKYGKLEDVLDSAAKWTVPVLISLDGNTRAFREPLVIVDPTDTNRNAAANVSAENLAKFIAKAKSFVKKPEKNYFFPPEQKPLSKQEIRQLRERKTKFIAITMKRPDVIDDTLYPQLRRALKRMEGLFGHNEFALMRGYEYADEKSMALAFELEVWELPAVKKMVGPPVFVKKHSEEFVAKYPSAHIEGMNWAADKEREFRTATELLKPFMKKKAAEMETMGIPDNIAKEFTKGKILEDTAFWNFVKKNKDFSAFLRKKYFERLF